ncbi:MAG: efflux RND transporter periplasmic adaptor subunit [Pseudomonadota bacterium]
MTDIDQHSGKAEPRSIIFRLANMIGVVTASALCIAAMAGGIALLQARAAAEGSVKSNPPISVETARFTRQASYKVAQTFIGRLEATRETRLAFELGGTVQSVDVDEGDRIERGSRIARLDTARLETRHSELIAQRKELEASLALARATAKRQSTLKDRGWTAAQSYDEARFEVARLEASIARIDASIATVKVDLEKSSLKAPFSGRIASRAIDEGAIVAAGTPVATLLEDGRARIRVGLSRAFAADLKPETPYKFAAGTMTITGKLVGTRPDLEPQSRTVTALFETQDHATLPYGAVVSLSVKRTLDEPGGWVPLAALSEGQKGVWSLFTIVTEGGRAIVRREAVEVLHVADAQAYVKGSLADGTRFIVKGANRVTPGQRVALFERR